MKALLDANGNVSPVVGIGIAKDYEAGVIENQDLSGIIRVKALEDTRIALFGETSDGVFLQEGEIEYFLIKDGQKINILSGKVNIMY